jgi:redox-sensitive bicupin YhaK (pirin superfamily)
MDVRESQNIHHFEHLAKGMYLASTPGMLTIRRAQERGHANHGWLDSHHTFSFAEYHDPKHMGFRGLRVINEDRVAPGRGFGTHPHRDMEIISYVLDGGLEHRDSLGTGSVIRNGEVQRMSAGTGVRHSEFNTSKTEPVHFLQIWILPAEKNIEPSYEQRAFDVEQRRNQLRLVVDPQAHEGALKVNADARLFASLLDAGASVTHEVPRGRHAWVQVARGTVEVGGTVLRAGDGASTSDAGPLTIKASEDAELLVFDLA